MAPLRILWLSLLPCLTLAQVRGGETTVDYNIYYDGRQENVGGPFVVKPGRQENPELPFDIKPDVNKFDRERDGVLKPKPFEETNPTKTDDGRDLFDGDILLTDAQWRDLALRKGVASEQSLWPDGEDGFPRVPFRFADAEVDQTAVRNGIAHWEQHTCIRFEETTDANQHHLKFQKLSGCWSYIGRVSSYTTGQQISIGSGCTSLGIVAHEIGHAMGFYHEQSRPDRDGYVHINTENIVEGYEGNYGKASETQVNNREVPYDFTSDMHYGGRGFTKDGKMTIVTLDPLNQELIGSRDGLSHRDTHLANLMYGCIDKWLGTCGQSSDSCQNGGYTGSNCACVCPPGTSGSQCETIEADYYADKRTTCSQKITSPGTVTSPNYPNNYPAGLSCAKWIVAPRCKAPKITFNAFNVLSCSYRYDFLEIRTSNRNNGDYYCGTDIAPGTSITSTTNELIMMFYTYSNYETGWSVDLTFEDIPNCDTQSTTQTPSTQAPTTDVSTTHPTTTQAPTTDVSTTQAPPDCSLEYTSTGVNWYSPNFGADNYLDNWSCGLMRTFDVPRKGIFKFNTFDLQPKVNRKCVDYVNIQIPYSRTQKFCGGKSGVYRTPIMNLDIDFITDDSVNDVGFNVSISWKETSCHQIIELPDDDSVGVIKSPNYPDNYPKNALCEWWLVAPEGRRIQLDFTEIVFTSNNCKRAYIAVDKAGSTRYYRETSELFCPSSASASVTSDAHLMNVAFAGGSKRSKGFRAQYTLV